MYRATATLLALVLAGCQGMPPAGGEAIPSGTRIEVPAATTLAVDGYRVALQGGRVVTARQQSVWQALCLLRLPATRGGNVTLPPGAMEVGRVTSDWRFQEISVHKYSADIELAKPYAGVHGIQCEIWAGAHWKDGEVGLDELKSALEPTFHVRPPA